MIEPYVPGSGRKLRPVQGKTGVDQPERGPGVVAERVGEQ